MTEIDNEHDCGSYWMSTALFNSLTGVLSASVSMFFFVSCSEAAPLALKIWLYLFVSMDARLQNLDQHSS